MSVFKKILVPTDFLPAAAEAFRTAVSLARTGGGEVVVAHVTRAPAVVVENGEEVSLAGTSWLRFDDDGRVVDQHDYWGTAPGRTLPWDGWGVTSTQ